MNQPQIGDHVTIETPHGELAGRVVGLESRPTSRNGDGPTKPFICVALDQVAADSWRWLPVASVTSCTPDPDRQAVAQLVNRLGFANVVALVDAVTT